MCIRDRRASRHFRRRLWQRHPFPTVDIDNRLASRKLTEHMLGRGYRRIAYIIGPSYLPTPTPACPQLTTVRQPMDAFGVSLATLVLDQIEDRPFQRTGLLPTEVVAR